MTIDLIIRIIADVLVIPIVLIAAWALLFKVKSKDRFAIYSRIILAGLSAYMIAKFTAFVYQPETMRPFEKMGVEPGAFYLNNGGFPSDHALFVIAIVCAVWFGTRMKRLTLALATLALLVCLGRVLALVHTPLDVIAGVIIALVGALWYSNVPSRQESHGDGKSHRKRAKRRRTTVVG